MKKRHRPGRLLAPSLLVLLLLSLFAAYCQWKRSKLHLPQPLPSSPVSPSLISHGNRQKKTLALTFDADMTPFMENELKTGKIKSLYNQEIISLLRQNQVPATLFISGLWARIYPVQLRDLSTDPLFEIANHSYSHPGFTQNCYTLKNISTLQKDYEFQQSQKILAQITGATPKLFRFPGGCHDDTAVKQANKYGLTVVDWDLSSTDAFNNDENSIVQQVLSKAQNGSIIVFHLHGGPNAPKTAPALKSIIPVLKDKGFSFVKVSDMLGV